MDEPGPRFKEESVERHPNTPVYSGNLQAWPVQNRNPQLEQTRKRGRQGRITLIRRKRPFVTLSEGTGS